MSKRVQQAFEHEVRIEKVVDFASMWNSLQDCIRVPDRLEEIIEDSFDDPRPHPSMKPFVDRLRIDDEDIEMSTLEKLQDFPAAQADVVFMQGLTPVRHYHNAKGWSSGWGYCYTKWVMAPTFTEGWNMLLKWAQEMHDKDKAEAS
jgi:hypothetical protein